MNDEILSGTNNAEGTLTSGSKVSYWIDSVAPLAFTPLNENIETETVIIGGGISGLTVAYCLAKAGTRVVLLEDGFIGSGETGRTTAHIVNALDDRYSTIEKRLGEPMAALAAASHTAAIDFIEQVIQEEHIDCDFRRVDGYLFLHPSDKLQTLKDEHAATHRVGIATEWVESVPGVASAKGPCLKFPNQAQFHPMKYLHGIAAAFIRYGGKIYTESSVRDISKDHVVANGFKVTATEIVVATNSPINDWVTMHTKQHAYRTYVIGALIPKDAISPALWWDTGDMDSTWVADPYHYVRLQTYNETHDLLIAGGEDHKTGQADKEEIPEQQRFDKLIGWTKEHFPAMEEVVYTWSGQVLEPIDCMAFIGRNPGEKNTYIVTGDSGNGITHGTIAGMLIRDLILKGEHPWEKLYDPARITLKAAGDFLKEAGNMAAQYLDFLAPGDIKSLEDLKPGQGAIMNIDAKKTAVYRDDKSVLHAYSAICPHLGCVVQWNNAEKSFDCPCHGSRFTCEGKVVNGPSVSDLKAIRITADSNV